MKALLHVLFLGLVVAGCGKVPTSGPAYLHQAKFDDLAKAHNTYVPTMGITIAIEDLGDAKEKVDCPARQVSIDSKVWSDSRDGYQEAAVFHVLAHCLLERGHFDGNTSSGKAISEPWSLMDPDLVPGELYVGDKERYIDELFTAPFINDTLYP